VTGGDRGGWDDAVVYQVYPRSFQDSDGSGEGDLRGIASRLEHIAWLGADALWLSPIYPSPMADGGYDVADYEDVDPRFGSLADAEHLIEETHRHGLRILLDTVPCHTSIEHRWFREHPDRYVWSPVDGPPNNWHAAFGGRAWSRDRETGRWYLHSFYPEQPDLDWRKPSVPEAFGEGLRFWLDRGVDGFRVDAVDRLLKDPALRDDPPASGPPPLPLQGDAALFDHVNSRNAPDIGTALAQLREAAGDAFLVGEAYLPSADLGPYLEHLDACFGFELFHSRWNAAALRRALQAAAAVGPKRVAWVLSNHDFPRLPDRVGEGNIRAAALLLLSLPGPVFIYQGDEIGMADGPGRTPPDDRAGRDPFRHPMAWDDSPHGGFTRGEPWLPATGAPGGSVAAQREDPDSLLHLYRDLIALRKQLGGPVEILDAADGGEGLLTLRRGPYVVAVNVGAAPAPAPRVRSVVRHTQRRGLAEAPPTLAPGEGFVGLA
jgi:alpha-glucosidase